jgi:hypothetical protein
VIVSGLLDPHHHRHLWPPVALLQAELLAGPSWSMSVLDLTAMTGDYHFSGLPCRLAGISVWAFCASPTLAIPDDIGGGLTIVATLLCEGH